MFQHAFQSGVSVEVVSSTEKSPNWTISKPKYKVYDKSAKGYIITLDSHTARLSYPNNERQSLGLVQPFLVLQGYIHPTQTFSLELSISDTTSTRRRLLFTSSAKEMSSSPLFARVPSSVFLRGVWANMSIDLVSYFRSAFPTVTFRSIDSITIHSYCKIRRVFTMRSPILDTTGDAPNTGNVEAIPRTYEFPPGVPYINQMVRAEDQRPPEKSIERSVEKPTDKTAPAKLIKSPARKPPTNSVYSAKRTATSSKFSGTPNKSVQASFTGFPARIDSAGSTRYNQFIEEEKEKELSSEGSIENPMDMMEEIKESIHIYSSVENEKKLKNFNLVSQSIKEEIEEPAVEETEEKVENDYEIEHNYFRITNKEDDKTPQPNFYNFAFTEVAQPRPFTPPFSGLQSMKNVQVSKDSLQEEEEEEVELVYDPVLKCYYDPNTHEYYEIND